jgi:hypothetical protein
MRRAKLGDVYAMHLPNGIKIFQWAYHIPKYGKYIRVFDGLYQTIPADLNQIVQGEHSYIICCDVSAAYRIGLIDFLENVPVPVTYEFPLYRINFWFYDLTDKFGVWIRPTIAHSSENINKIFSYDNLDSLKELPVEFQNIKLMNCYVSFAYLMYLFEYDFTFDNPRRFKPGYVLGEKAEAVLTGYEDQVNRLWEADRAKRNANKK